MGALWSEDYEKVFGKPTKWTLFPEEEEAYRAFRQTIIDSPHYVYDKSKLPFTGVQLYGDELHSQLSDTEGENENDPFEGYNPQKGNAADIIALLQSPFRFVIGGLQLECSKLLGILDTLSRMEE